MPDPAFDNFTANFLLFCVVMFGASLFPGPSFLLTFRNGLKYSSRIGIAGAIGLGFGLLPNVLASILGVAALIHSSDMLYDLVRYAGAAFLMLLGIQSLFFAHAKTAAKMPALKHERQPDPSLKRAFIEGFLTNATNPKGILFFVAVFTQFVTAETVFWQKAAYGTASFLIEMIWFCCLTLILHHPALDKFTAFFMKYIDRLCGFLFFCLALKLLIA